MNYAEASQLIVDVYFWLIVVLLGLAVIKLAMKKF